MKPVSPGRPGGAESLHVTAIAWSTRRVSSTRLNHHRRDTPYGGINRPPGSPAMAAAREVSPSLTPSSEKAVLPPASSSAHSFTTMLSSATPSSSSSLRSTSSAISVETMGFSSPALRTDMGIFLDDGFRPDSPKLLLLEEMAETTKITLIIGRTPHISGAARLHHSRHASVESSMSTDTDTAVTEEPQSVDEEDGISEYSRSSTPVSIANTFGGNHRSSSFRYRQTGIAHSRVAPPYSASSTRTRSVRSDSLASQTTDASHAATTIVSVVPDRFTSRRGPAARSLLNMPPATDPSGEMSRSEESTSWPSAADTGYKTPSPLPSLARDWVADQALRSVPGVVGVGEGWAGGLQKGRGRRTRWFKRGKGRMEHVGENPLALWTVVETEERISPFKSAWNRSRAKFGASTPVLSMASSESPTKRGGKSRSMFSLNRTDPSPPGRRGSEPIVLSSSLHAPQIVLNSPVDGPGLDPFWSSLGEDRIDKSGLQWLSPPHGGPSCPSTRRSSMSFGSRRYFAPYQPHLPPPRSASLPLATAAASFGPSAAATDMLVSDLSLSRMNTFGCDPVSERQPDPSPRAEYNASQVGKMPEWIRSGPIADPLISEQTEQNRQGPISSGRAESRTSKIRQRLSLVTSAINWSNSGTKSQSTQRGDQRLAEATAGSDSHLGRLRPISMIPLATGEDHAPSPARLSETRTGMLRLLLGKLAGRASEGSEGRQRDQDARKRDEAAGHEKRSTVWQRRSFTLSLPRLGRWSLSQNDLLQSEHPDTTDTLEDLIARFQSIDPPRRDGATPASPSVTGQSRIDALKATRQTLMGEVQCPHVIARSDSETSTALSTDTLLVTPSKPMNQRAAGFAADPSVDERTVIPTGCGRL